MQITIEKNHPLPKHWNSERKRARKYPLDEMQVGDSFFTANSRNALACAASYYKKKTKKQFAVRTVEENGVTGCRVWRVK